MSKGKSNLSGRFNGSSAVSFFSERAEKRMPLQPLTLGQVNKDLPENNDLGETNPNLFHQLKHQQTSEISQSRHVKKLNNRPF